MEKRREAQTLAGGGGAVLDEHPVYVHCPVCVYVCVCVSMRVCFYMC